MPIKTTKETAQPLPIIAPPQVPQTVGGITTMSASVAPPVISSQTNAGQGIKAKPNTAPQTINAGTDKYLAQGMNNQQAYEQSMKDYNVSKGPAPAVAPVNGSLSPATPNKPIVPAAPVTPETTPTPAGGAPMVTPPKQVATPIGQQQGTTGIYDSATPDQKANADKMVKLMDPFNSLDASGVQDMKDAFASGDVSKIQTLANAYGMEAQQTASVISAFRTARDADLTANRNEEITNRDLDQAQRSYDDAIAQQKSRIEAVANQMAIMQETSGRMQSRNMANGIINAMEEQQRILRNLKDSKDSAFKEIVSNAEYNHKILANNFNDAMSRYDYSVQDKIKNLLDTGQGKTAEGLKMAQSAIEQAQLQKLALGAQYAQSLQQAVEITKMQIAKGVADTEQTKLINDGYLHNAQGEVVMGPTGKPLTYNTQKDIKQIVDDGKGGKLAVYSDGTTSQITEGQVATPEEIQNYVKAVNQNPALFNALSDSIKPQVLAAIGKSVTAPSETAIMGYAYEVAKNGIGAIKDLTPEQQNKVLEMYANMPVDERNNVKKGARNITKVTDADGNEVLIDTDTMKVVYGKGAQGGAGGSEATTQYGTGTTDFRGLASKYPNVAAFKNNNTSGITWNSSFDNPTPGSTAQRLIDAGIHFSKGTPRPASEGGNYVMFDSIEDGTAAQRVMIEGTYGKSTVGKMLSSWVGTSEGPAYAKQVAAAAGVNVNDNISDLSKEQLDALQIAKINKESPELMKELTAAGIVDNGTINFAQVPRFTLEEAASGIAGDSAKSFADSIKAGTVTGPQATPTQSNKYTDIAQQLINGTINPSDLQNLGYSKSDIKAIESERIRLSKVPTKTNEYSGALGTVLGSGKFTKDQEKAVKEAINNGEDPITVLKNQAKNIMGQTEATKVTNFEVAKSSLNDLSNSLKEFYKNGGKTDIFSGNIEKTINKLGEVDDPKLVEIATQIQSALQIYRNAVSGTAYSEQEGADIASIFPGINKSQGLNESIIKGREKAFDSVIDGSYRSTLGSAYDKLKNTKEMTQPGKNLTESNDYKDFFN